ncbi:MAG TPA: DUF4440 domain-containing protein [Longimicrobiaceae bacterium]|nr:DUF4440 domain-containing protein [Longimicrobiaceae bacterium]
MSDHDASVLAADRALSAATAAHGWVEGFAPFLAEDAVFLAENHDVVRGARDIRDWLDWSPFAGATARWEPIRGRVSADSTLGYTFGEGTLTRADGSSGVIRYIAAWTEENGEWKLAAFLPVLATAAGAPPPEGFRTMEGSRGSVRPLDPDAAREEVMQADRDFAALAAAQGPQAAFATYAAPDGVVVGGGGIAYGREAIRRSWEGSRTVLAWGPILGAAAASGDLGVTVGTAEGRAPGPDGAERVFYTQYLSIWERQPGGEWRYAADGGNLRRSR